MNEPSSLSCPVAAEDFTGFPKIARFARPVVITEKLDGTNSQILITDDLRLFTGSKNRWITPANDNYGFARWALERKDELLKLGPGRHFGEWWGNGIQRGYGLANGDKRFSLFNTSRWCLHGRTPKQIPTADPRIVKWQDELPACVGLVPVLYEGAFDTDEIDNALFALAQYGSKAAPGFPDPEGIVIFHLAGNVGFKKTIKNDAEPKSGRRERDMIT